MTLKMRVKLVASLLMWLEVIDAPMWGKVNWGLQSVVGRHNTDYTWCLKKKCLLAKNWAPLLCFSRYQTKTKRKKDAKRLLLMKNQYFFQSCAISKISCRVDTRVDTLKVSQYTSRYAKSIAIQESIHDTQSCQNVSRYTSWYTVWSGTWKRKRERERERKRERERERFFSISHSFILAHDTIFLLPSRYAIQTWLVYRDTRVEYRTSLIFFTYIKLEERYLMGNFSWVFAAAPGRREGIIKFSFI